SDAIDGHVVTASDFPDELVQECRALRWQFCPGAQSVDDLGVVLNIGWFSQVEGTGELVKVNGVVNLGLRETQYGDGPPAGHSGTERHYLDTDVRQLGNLDEPAKLPAHGCGRPWLAPQGGLVNDRPQPAGCGLVQDHLPLRQQADAPRDFGLRGTGVEEFDQS